MKYTRVLHYIVACLATTALFGTMACTEDSDPTALVVVTLRPISGTGQTAWPGQMLPVPLAVEAVDSDGARVVGATVAWSVVGGDGTLDRSSSVTGTDGTAEAVWSLGPAVGTQEVWAQTGGATTTFTAEAGLSGSWERIADLIYAVRAPAVATDGSRIFVFGGSAGASPRTRHTQIFNPATGSWSLGVPIPTAVEWSTVVYFANRFHLLGGVTDQRAATDEHWIYDPVSDAWSSGPPLPLPAAGSASGILGSQIIVAAGIDGPGAYSDNVHFFDPAAGTWSSGPPTPALLINWQAAVLNGKLYAAGGSGPGRITSDKLLSYDPGTQLWSEGPSMFGPNEGYAGTGFLGFYCIVGGRVTPSFGSFSTPFDRFECYEPTLDRWYAGPDLPSPAQEIGAASLDGYFYSIGGRPTSSGASALVYRIGPGRPAS